MKIKHILSVAAIIVMASATQKIELHKGWTLVGIIEKGKFKISEYLTDSNSKVLLQNAKGTISLLPISTEIEKEYNYFEGSKAYWIYVGSDRNITLDGNNGVLSSISEENITAGWNFIAVPNNDTIKNVEKYFASDYKFEMILLQNAEGIISLLPISTDIEKKYNNFIPGKGYWIKVQKQIASKTYADGKVKVVVYSDKETNVKPVINIDENGNVTISGVEGVTGTVGILVADGDNYKEVETYSLVNGTVQNVSNNTIAITDDIINQAVVNKVLYSVYYAPEGSAPVALSNVDVFDKDGKYIGSTDSAGRIQVPVTAGLVTFSKDGYATVTSKIDSSSSTSVVFLNTATKTNAATIDSGTTGNGRILNRALYKTSNAPKTLKNADGTFKADFYNFNIGSNENYYIKLAILDADSVTIDNDYQNIAGFAVELVSVDDNGIETLENKSYTEIDTQGNDAKVDVNITLSDNQVDLIKKAGNNLKIYEYKGKEWVPSEANATLKGNVLNITNTDRFTQYIVTYKPNKNALVEKRFYLVDENDNNITDTNATIIMSGKKYYADENGSFTFSGIIPSDKIVNVEVMAEGYEYFNSPIDFDKNNKITLTKKATAHTHYITVKDTNDNVLSDARVKVEIPVTLSSVRKKENKIYVGKSAKASYTWRIISSKGKYTLKENEKALNYVSLNDIYSKLKYNDDLIGDFYLEVSVNHGNGYTEKGKIAYLGIDVDAEKVVNKDNINQIGNLFGSLKDNGWVSFDVVSLKATNWKLKYSNYSLIIPGDTLIWQDISTFIKTYPSILNNGGTITAVAVDDGGHEKEANVTIPVNSVTETDYNRVLDTFVSTSPASSIPSIVDTTTDKNGKVDLSIIDKDLEVAVVVSKPGYRDYANKIKIDADEDTDNEIKLTKLAPVPGYTVKLKDKNGNPINSNVKIVIPEAYTVEVTDFKTGKTMLISKDYEKEKEIDDGVFIIDEGLIEGVKTLKVYAEGYKPYDGRIRVSTKVTSANVTLTKLENETFGIEITKPTVAITYSNMVKDKFILKGQIVDTLNQYTPYSGTATLTVILNGDSKSYPVKNDGTFNITLEPQDGINKVELIVANQKGKFDTGEIVFEYYDFTKDITDTDKIVKEANDTIMTQTVADEFILGSVIKDIKINNEIIKRGDTYTTSNAEINITVDRNSTDGTIYYIDFAGNEIPIQNNFALTLFPGFNPVQIIAKNDKGVVIDSFDFVVNSSAESPSAKTATLPLTVTDINNNPLTFDLLIMEDVNGQPGNIIDIKENLNNGDISVPVPSWLRVQKEGYIPQDIYIAPESNGKLPSLSIQLLKEGEFIDQTKLNTYDINSFINMVYLNGDREVYQGDWANFWLETNLPVDPQQFNFTWKIDNESIDECQNQPFCSTLINKDEGEHNISVDICKNSNCKTKQMTFIVNKNEKNTPVGAYIYIPNPVEIVKDTNFTGYAEFYNVSSLPSVNCQDKNIANATFNWEYNDANSDGSYYYIGGEIVINGINNGNTTCTIEYDDKNETFNVTVKDVSSVDYINGIYAFSPTLGKEFYNEDISIPVNNEIDLWADIKWDYIYGNINPQWKLFDKNGQEIVSYDGQELNYYFENEGNYTAKFILKVGDKTYEKEIKIHVNGNEYPPFEPEKPSKEDEGNYYPPNIPDVTGEGVPAVNDKNSDYEEEGYANSPEPQSENGGRVVCQKDNANITADNVKEFLSSNCNIVDFMDASVLEGNNWEVGPNAIYFDNNDNRVIIIDRKSGNQIGSFPYTVENDVIKVKANDKTVYFVPTEKKGDIVEVFEVDVFSNGSAEVKEEYFKKD